MEAKPITIKTPILMYPEAVRYFQIHGCQIAVVNEYREVTYPSGTRREESWPRPPQSAIYTLTFPDGAEAMEQYVRYLEVSVLFYRQPVVW